MKTTKSNAHHLVSLMRKLGFKTLASALMLSEYELPNKVFKDNGEGVSSSEDSSSSFHNQKR